MKLGIVGPTIPYKGGVAQHTTELAFRMRAAGHEVQLASWKAQYPRRLYPGQLEVSGGEGVPFPETRRSLTWYSPLSWYREARRLRDRELLLLCLVNVFQIPAYLVIARTVRAGGTRVAVLCHNVVPHDASFWQLSLIRSLFATVPLALVHSRDEADAAERLGAKSVSVAALPFFLPAKVCPVASFEEPTRRILFFGFVRPYKGLDLLIDAIDQASTQVSLRVVGEFWQPVEFFGDQVARLGLVGRVDLEDRYLRSEEVPALFEGIDALVVPYRSATGSQHPRLGHLCGVPVIVTDVGDLPSQVIHGVDGLVCAAGDAAAIASAIDNLYRPGVLESMRTRISEEPPADDWPNYVAALENLNY